MDPSGIFSSSYQEDKAIIRTKTQWLLLMALVASIFVMPIFLDRYSINVFNTMLITLIVVLGAQLVTGYCGQITLGQAAFMALGAYTSALLSMHLNFPFWLSLLCAPVVAGLGGLLVGLPALRVKGFYLVIATLAAHYIIIFALRNSPTSVTGGDLGLVGVPDPVIGNFIIDTDFRFSYITIVVTIVLTFFTVNLVRSKVGRAWVAIRDNDLAASAMGINVFRYKVLAFVLSAAYAGVAGCLWAHSQTGIHPDHFTFMNALWYLGMIIVGGLGSVTGAILGTAFLHLLQTGVVIISPIFAGWFPQIGHASFTGWSLLLFGGIIAFFLIFEPRGLYHRWLLMKMYYRFWPFRY